MSAGKYPGGGYNDNAGKAIANEFSYNYQELDDESLDKLTRNLGRDESPNMGKLLLRYYASLVQPQLWVGLDPASFRADNIFRNLPVWLYPAINMHMEYYLIKLREEGGAQGLNWQMIMPDWYLEYYQEKMDVALVNSYVVFVMNNFDQKTYGDNDVNEARREWFQKKFPWVVKERQKTWYMVQRLRNKFAEISSRGIKNQGDLLFLYFSLQLQRLFLTNGDGMSLIPREAENMFENFPRMSTVNAGAQREITSYGPEMTRYRTDLAIIDANNPLNAANQPNGAWHGFYTRIFNG